MTDGSLIGRHMANCFQIWSEMQNGQWNPMCTGGVDKGDWGWQDREELESRISISWS